MQREGEGGGGGWERIYIETKAEKSPQSINWDSRFV